MLRFSGRAPPFMATRTLRWASDDMRAPRVPIRQGFSNRVRHEYATPPPSQQTPSPWASVAEARYREEAPEGVHESDEWEDDGFEDNDEVFEFEEEKLEVQDWITPKKMHPSVEEIEWTLEDAPDSKDVMTVDLFTPSGMAFGEVDEVLGAASLEYEYERDVTESGNPLLRITPLHTSSAPFPILPPPMMPLPLLPNEEPEVLQMSFDTWTGALGMFFHRHLEEGMFGKLWLPPPSNMGSRYSIAPTLEPGRYHWSDADHHPHGLVVIKLKFERMNTVPYYGRPPAERAERAFIKRAIVIEWQARKLHCVQLTVGDDSSVHGRVHHIYPLSSDWISALKAVKWPSSWDEPQVLVTCGLTHGLMEDLALREYPLSFDQGVQLFKAQ